VFKARARATEPSTGWFSGPCPSLEHPYYYKIIHLLIKNALSRKSQKFKEVALGSFVVGSYLSKKGLYAGGLHRVPWNF
jgi:hypothetical protein